MGPFNLHAYNYPLKYFTKIVSYFKKCDADAVQAKTLYVKFAHTVKPEIFAPVLFSLISRVKKNRENKK